VVFLVAVMVASRASLTALRARYPRRVNIAVWCVLLHGLALVLLALAVPRGIVSASVLDAVVRATKWIVVGAGALATVYLSFNVLAERLLTLRPALVVVLVSAAFGAAWVTVLRTAGVPLGAMTTAHALWMLSPALLPPLVSVLAPWSLSRVRHT
jgi:hypothetical protein